MTDIYIIGSKLPGVGDVLFVKAPAEVFPFIIQEWAQRKYPKIREMTMTRLGRLSDPHVVDVMAEAGLPCVRYVP